MVTSVRRTRSAAKRSEPEDPEPEPEPKREAVARRTSPRGKGAGAGAETPSPPSKKEEVARTEDADAQGVTPAEAPDDDAPKAAVTASPSSSSKKKEDADEGSPPSKKSKGWVTIAPGKQGYPSITASMVKSLRWGDARDLMLPFLSDEEKNMIHKKTRADLQKLLEERILKGEVSPEEFWKVVGVEKANKWVPANRSVDPAVTEAIKTNKKGEPTPPPEDKRKDARSPPAPAAPKEPKASPPPKQKQAKQSPMPTPGPGMPGMAMPPGAMHPGMYPYPPRGMMPYPPGGSPPGARGMNMGIPPGPYGVPGMTGAPMPAPPRGPPVLYKYTLRVPASIWPSTNYPPGIVVGEPIPPPNPMSPPYVSGTFHGSAILALGPGDEVFHPNDVKKQLQYIFTKLDLVLAQLGANHSDVLSMTAHVVDVHENGREVMDAHGRYMAGRGRGTRSICSWTMIGVAGLMPKGCVVQLDVKAIVRRGIAANLILDRPTPPSQGFDSGSSRATSSRGRG